MAWRSTTHGLRARTCREGAKVVSPEDLAFDLEFGVGKLVVNYLNEDITYTVKATDYVDPSF